MCSVVCVSPIDSHVSLSDRTKGEEESGSAQVDKCSVGDTRLRGAIHSHRLEAAQVDTGGVGDARLRAAAHAQRVDAAQVNKCDVGDARLRAEAHVQRVDAPQVLGRRAAGGGVLRPAR